MLEMTAGTSPEGEKYDAIQRDIVINHVGLGPANWGRAGSEVRLRLDRGEVAYLEDESGCPHAPLKTTDTAHHKEKDLPMTRVQMLRRLEVLGVPQLEMDAKTDLYLVARLAAREANHGKENSLADVKQGMSPTHLDGGGVVDLHEDAAEMAELEKHFDASGPELLKNYAMCDPWKFGEEAARKAAQRADFGNASAESHAGLGRAGNQTPEDDAIRAALKAAITREGLEHSVPIEVLNRMAAAVRASLGVK